jgi:hypothetical protein
VPLVNSWHPALDWWRLTENIRTEGGGAKEGREEDQLLISVKYIGSISIVYV